MKINCLGLPLLACVFLATGLHAADTNAPLPTLAEIFERVMARARQERDNDRAFSSQYYFVKSKTTEFRNGKGEIRKQESKVSTNNPALLRAALAAPAAPKKTPPKHQAVSDTQSNVRGKAFSEDEFLVNRDLVKRFEFALLGREDWQGRSMLLLEFHPAKGELPERDLKDKFINRTAGRVWIDEEDYALAKAALHLTERVNVLGGLVGAVRKFTFEFERQRVADALWFTRLTTWHLEGREVFVPRVIDFREERNLLETTSQATRPSLSIEPTRDRDL